MRGSKSLAGAFAAVGLAAVGLAGAAGAHAQPPPPGPAVDSERLALAQQIYQMVGAPTLTATSSALKTMLGSVTAPAAGADPAREQAMKAALTDSVDRMIPKVLQGTVQIMAQDFTVEQLRGMLAFYQSPTGQAVLLKMPEVTSQSIRLSRSLIPAMMRDFETDYCRRIACTDKEQAAFAQVNARLSQAFASSSPPPSP